MAIDAIVATEIPHTGSGRSDLWGPANAALRAAQAELVNSVCRSCWEEGLKKVLWVNAYVELATSLAADLVASGHSEAGIATMVLFNPAGIALPQEDLDAFHSPFVAQLSEPGTQSLTSLLTREGAPDIVRITFTGEDLEWDWRLPNGATVPLTCNQSPYSTFIFAGERSGGEYVHLSYPYRGSTLARRLGPAGVYLFLADRGLAIPPCLIARLRLFIQSLATAQLWVLSKYLAEDIKRASLPFALYHGHFVAFGKAAAMIAKRVDPLDPGTSPLQELKGKASFICDAEKGGAKRWHRLYQIRENDDELACLLAEFEGYLSECKDSRIGHLLWSTFVKEPHDVRGRWSVVNACYKLRLPMHSLTGAPEDYDKHLQEYFIDHNVSEKELDRWRAIAAVQLAEWKMSGLQFRLDVETSVLLCSADPAAPEPHPPLVKMLLSEPRAEDWLRLKKAARDYVEGTRARLDSGGNAGRELARVVRGLSGGSLETYMSEVTERDGMLALPIRVATP